MHSAFRVQLAQVSKANGDRHRWSQFYWYASKPVSPTLFSPHDGTLPFPRSSFRANWPRKDEVTLSVPHRAKVAGFTTLIVILDAFLVGWRTHDLDTVYLPVAMGVGMQVDTSDPVFVE
jgi:hypothetical protein